MRILLITVICMFFMTACTRTQVSESKTKTVQPEEGCCVPEILDKTWYTSGKPAPLFSGLDGIEFELSSPNAEAKKYFKQGLMLSFGFNHAEAARSFFEAARKDSLCAMCWWGYAYVLGPNYNAGMEPDNFQRAFEAVMKAKKLSATASQKEKDLIHALTFRYSNDTTIARTTLDSVYATEMRKVCKKYPGDVNIAALFAESLMDLHPWNLWNKDGSMQPWTPEIVDILERAIKKEPRHAGANHFYIHAMEMSDHAEAADASAEILPQLVPGSGHLVHMPSHIYIRTGKYHEGVLANQAAVEVDSLYMEACHAQGVYPLAYYPHNYHFIAACATFSGESRHAMKGAIATSDHAHKKLLREPAWATLQHYYAIPWYVQVKLGLWEQVRRSAAPEEDLTYPLIVWHYAQGMASLAASNTKNAERNLTAINTLMQDSGLKDLTIWGINSIYNLCEIAAKTLEGEILAKKKKYPEAIAILKEATAMEDALNYDEPPDWFFSVRHHLGAVMIEAGKFSDAEKIYLEDLRVYRENGWALKGLMNSYEGLKDPDKYESAKRRFESAWKHADIRISSSRII
jgi:tetratricopeptide (TPR) repeat protein